MKVFISWSGGRSRAVAELLNDWIKCVLQAVKPWLSTRDIDRGALWFNEIHDQLKDTTVGIVCLTLENKDRPWILFESGALAKGLSSSRVCTFLIDLKPMDIGDPLAQFNHTLPEKESLWALIRTLNNCLTTNNLEGKILDQVFETYWDYFQSRFNEILKTHPSNETVEPRAKDDMLLEILETTRSLHLRLGRLEKQQSKDSLGRIKFYTQVPEEEEEAQIGKNLLKSFREVGLDPDSCYQSLIQAGISKSQAFKLLQGEFFQQKPTRSQKDCDPTNE